MKKTFSIPNIACHHCVNSIKNELFEIDNVEQVNGSPERKTVTVEWSEPLTEEAIRNVLKTINYPADESNGASGD